MVESDTAQVSVLPVAGCEFPAVFLGNVALGLGVSPAFLQVDSEEILVIDERAQMIRAGPSVTQEGGSVEGVPVLEPIEHSVLTKPLDGSLKERMPVMKPLEHAILATVWESLEHLHCVVSDHVAGRSAIVAGLL